MKLTKMTKYALFAACAIMFASCAQTEKKETSAKTEAKEMAESGDLMKIRYIDEDSLLSKYNLAKDLSESNLKLSNQYDAAQQQRATEINKFAGEVQRKYKNNGYLTEESFNVDQQKLNKMQVDAQNYLGRLQRDIENQVLQNNIQLNDSVNNYLKIYAKEKGYDMIIRKSAAFFINDKYNVTDEVVEALNKRYNKVEKK
ncbi:MAG: OmpH family outer membrane protein [Bacteroidales bacterium]|nr:OmpH family outer membrane protein [Bacteroidales bacterium]